MTSFSIGLSAIYNTKNWKDQLLFIASSEPLSGLSTFVGRSSVSDYPTKSLKMFCSVDQNM